MLAKAGLADSTTTTPICLRKSVATLPPAAVTAALTALDVPVDVNPPWSWLPASTTR